MDEPNILIKTALSEAVQKVNSGMSPTEALKKVASDLDLNPNYIQRTGEALNVALHYKHFKTASDRSVDFEIADIPKAIQDNFTFSEKTASELISDCFSVAGTDETVFNYNRMLSNPVYKRAFLEISEAKETHDTYPTTFAGVYEKSANYIQKLSKQAEAAEVAKSGAEFYLNAQFSSLSDEFRKDAGYRTAFEEFESQVFSKHGEAAIPYLDLLHKTACQQEERGVHDTGYIMFEQCKEAALFDRLMDAATTWISSQKTAEDTAHDLAYEEAYLKEVHKQLGKQSEKPPKVATVLELEEAGEKEEIEEESKDPVIAAVKKKASESGSTENLKVAQDPVIEQVLEKEALFGGLLNPLSTVSKFLGGQAHELVHSHASSAFEDVFKSKQHTGPKPNLTLENLERKLLLQELMMTDPILSKVNPAKIARAFEQILRLSPEISKEKEVVRAELRAMVATQALSKYDADLLTKLDTGMVKRRAATQQFNTGRLDTFRI